MRRLIINADDLGLTPGVNQAILDANEDGVVTSATLMAGGAALHDAVERLNSRRGSKNLSIGCHLTLVDGRPLSPPHEIQSLLTGASEFRQSIGQIAFAARRGQLNPSEIERETGAQFQALISSGIRVSHFDAHKHAHMFPEVLEPALRAAKAFGIRAVRNPFESSHPLPYSSLIRHPKLTKRYIQVAVLRSMKETWTDLVHRHGLKTPDGSLGVIVTGDLDETLLRLVLERMPEGIWELVCHPGYSDADLANVRTRLRASRNLEFTLLTAPETRRLIERLGIELISYNDV